MKPCAVLFLAAVLTASGAVPGVSMAARSECNPWALRPCAPVILWSAPPSSKCCAKLREQRRCLCRYARDPDLGKYINSQSSKDVAAACRVRVPMC